MSHGSAGASVGAVSGKHCKQVIPSSWRYNDTISSEGGTEILRYLIYTIFGKGILLATSAFIERHYEDTLCAKEDLCRKVSQFSITGGETMYV